MRCCRKKQEELDRIAAISRKREEEVLQKMREREAEKAEKENRWRQEAPRKEEKSEPSGSWRNKERTGPTSDSRGDRSARDEPVIERSSKFPSRDDRAEPRFERGAANRDTKIERSDRRVIGGTSTFDKPRVFDSDKRGGFDSDKRGYNSERKFERSRDEESAGNDKTEVRVGGIQLLRRLI